MKVQDQFITNYHVIEATFLGATNTRGSRVRINSPRFEQKVIIGYDHKFNSCGEVAADYLSKNGFNIIGCGESKNGYFIITDTFEPLKEIA